MINFQRILGRQDEFFTLLEASAHEGATSVAALKSILSAPRHAPPSLDDFAAARRRDKKITTQLEEMLITTFVTPLEREDLEALGEALYKIPKTVEKFAERYRVAFPQIADTGFERQMALVEQAVGFVLKMVQALREGDLGDLKGLQNGLQAVESEADDVLTDFVATLYAPGFPSLKAVILKELSDLLEKVIDRCRDAGNVISHVLLKNS
jgi:uncharacterized protein Yka (UPF0111/DUF47 family)